MTTDEMLDIRNTVIAAWPQAANYPTSSWDIWWDELHAFPGALVEYVVRAATSRQFPPSPFDIATTCGHHARTRARQVALRAGIDQW